jgi:hypothetical protein
VTISNDATVSGTLAFTAGKITTGGNNLVLLEFSAYRRLIISWLSPVPPELSVISSFYLNADSVRRKQT